MILFFRVVPADRLHSQSLYLIIDLGRSEVQKRQEIIPWYLGISSQLCIQYFKL